MESMVRRFAHSAMRIKILCFAGCIILRKIPVPVIQVFYIHEVQRSAQNRSMMDDFAMSGEYAKSYV
ncbi:hypothetical protein LFZ32_23520 [Salmonella enterica subsp. enterica serovar Newport str. L0167]|nr:hypothetical protein LFZ32_23520 [Salmonella enterica subsp. enterica serovar Newport str. L0167]